MIVWFSYGVLSLIIFVMYLNVLNSYTHVPSRGLAITVGLVMFLGGPFGTIATTILLLIACVRSLDYKGKFKKIKEWLNEDVL